MQSHSLFKKTELELLADQVIAGSKEAEQKLVQSFVDTPSSKTSEITKIIGILQQAANQFKSRGAAFVLGRVYAGIYYHDMLLPTLPHLAMEKRIQLAEQYLSLAIERQHAHAFEILYAAYLNGEIGCIKANKQKWQELCKTLTESGHQKAALIHGCILIGKKIDGSALSHSAFIVAPNPVSAKKYLIKATRGEDFELALTALKRLCALPEDMTALIRDEINSGNSVLAFYQAWNQLTMEQKSQYPAFMRELPTSKRFVDQSATDETLNYLIRAAASIHAPIRQTAQELISHFIRPKTSFTNLRYAAGAA